MRNKTRFVSMILSLLLLITVFAIGCTPAQRPNTTDRYGTRFDLTNNDRYGNRTGIGPNDNGWNDRAMDKYGTNLGESNNINNNNGFFDNNDPNNNMGYDGIPNNMGQRWGTNNTTANTRRNLEASIEQIANVDDATAVTNGNTCYVAVDTNDNRINNTAALRTEIANRVRRINPNINRVYVTTDDQGLDRLRGFANDIDNGQPIRNFLNDIENIFR